MRSSEKCKQRLALSWLVWRPNRRQIVTKQKRLKTKAKNPCKATNAQLKFSAFLTLQIIHKQSEQAHSLKAPSPDHGPRATGRRNVPYVLNTTKVKTATATLEQQLAQTNCLSHQGWNCIVPVDTTCQQTWCRRHWHKATQQWCKWYDSVFPIRLHSLSCVFYFVCNHWKWPNVKRI